MGSRPPADAAMTTTPGRCRAGAVEADARAGVLMTEAYALRADVADSCRYSSEARKALYGRGQIERWKSVALVARSSLQSAPPREGSTR